MCVLSHLNVDYLQEQLNKSEYRSHLLTWLYTRVSDLAKMWVRLAPNGDKSGTFSDQFSGELVQFKQLSLLTRHVSSFPHKLYQVGTKWDKSGTFSD